MAGLIRSRFAHFGFLITRPTTLGVRAVVIDRDEEVLLVSHGYVSGWHFPGGGVEVGETCREALARELKEEASVALKEPPLLHGVFFNARSSRRDHVPCTSSGPSTFSANARPTGKSGRRAFSRARHCRKGRRRPRGRGSPRSSIRRLFPTAGDGPAAALPASRSGIRLRATTARGSG
jgi:hypothetical protein